MVADSPLEAAFLADLARWDSPGDSPPSTEVDSASSSWVVSSVEGSLAKENRWVITSTKHIMVHGFINYLKEQSSRALCHGSKYPSSHILSTISPKFNTQVRTGPGHQETMLTSKQYIIRSSLA